MSWSLAQARGAPGLWEPALPTWCPSRAPTSQPQQARDSDSTSPTHPRNFWRVRHWSKKTLFWLCPPAPIQRLQGGDLCLAGAGIRTTCSTASRHVLRLLLPSADQLTLKYWTELISAAGLGSRWYPSKALRVTTLRWYFFREKRVVHHSQTSCSSFIAGPERCSWSKVHLTAQDPATGSFYRTNYLSVILFNQKLTVKTLYLIV